MNQFKEFGLPKGPKAPNQARREHLKMLQSMRRSGNKTPVARDSEGRSYAYTPLSIPELDYYVLLARNPELGSNDPETQRRAWTNFINSDVSIPYRTSQYVGVKQQDRGIILK